MKLKEYSIEFIAKIIAGDTTGFPRRSQKEIYKFFSEFSVPQDYDLNGNEIYRNRVEYAEYCVQELQSSRKEMIAKLLDPRRFLENNCSIGDAIIQLNECLRYDGYEVVPDGFFYKVIDLPSNILKVESQVKIRSQLTQSNIDESVRKCEERLKNKDFSGAITSARTLVENILVGIAADDGAPILKQDGDLIAYYRHFKKHLNLDPERQDISEILKGVLTGLTSIVNGLSAIRNQAGDAHSVTYKPDHHHAKLAINAAMTFVDFLFSTRDYQKKRNKEKSKKELA
ncbi:MAG: abortive infection family protein [Gammaproteobacteria bacterium]|nr:abortive infection family protein [Gammaproteobacteria bacterium]MCD8543234.1 abortive infection family protein [Gammaproteobacteria bacterium]